MTVAGMVDGDGDSDSVRVSGSAFHFFRSHSHSVCVCVCVCVEGKYVNIPVIRVHHWRLCISTTIQSIQ